MTSNLLNLRNLTSPLLIYRRSLSTAWLRLIVLSTLGFPDSRPDFDKDNLNVKKTLARLIRFIWRKLLKISWEFPGCSIVRTQHFHYHSPVPGQGTKILQTTQHSQK